MYHMLSCFNLKPGITVDAFQRSLDALNSHLMEVKLLHETSRIGRRDRHEIMDTDSERDLEYYFINTFEDRAQCDRAVAYMQQPDKPAHAIHESVYSKIAEPVFVCWEDI